METLDIIEFGWLLRVIFYSAAVTACVLWLRSYPNNRQGWAGLTVAGYWLGLTLVQILGDYRGAQSSEVVAMALNIGHVMTASLITAALWHASYIKRVEDTVTRIVNGDSG